MGLRSFLSFSFLKYWKKDSQDSTNQKQRFDKPKNAQATFFFDYLSFLCNLKLPIKRRTTIRTYSKLSIFHGFFSLLYLFKLLPMPLRESVR